MYEFDEKYWDELRKYYMAQDWRWVKKTHRRSRQWLRPNKYGGATNGY